MTSQDQPRRLRLRRKHSEPIALRPEAAQPPVCEKLRAARQVRGLDFFRIERDTKIRVRFLEAIEDGRFADLPGEIYTRGFIRNYAAYLGLDADAVEEQWRVETGQPAPPPLTPKIKPLPREHIPQPMPDVIVSPPKPVRRPAASAEPGFPTETEEGATAGSRLRSALPGLPRPSMPALPRPSVPSLGLPEFKRPTLSDLALRLRRGSADEGARTAGGSSAPAIGGPGPVAVSGRRVVLQAPHLVLLAMAAVVVIVAGFFGLHWTRVVDYPTVTVASPSKAVTTLSAGTAEYVLSGKATPGSIVLISWDLRDPNSVKVEANGSWEFETPLHSGINQFGIWSRNEQTNHDSPKLTIVLEVSVPTASPAPKLLVVDSPTDGQLLKSGDLTVNGSAVGLVSVMITPAYIGPPPAPGTTPRPLPTQGAPTEIPTMMPLPTPTATIPAGQSPTPRPTPTRTPAPSGSLGPEPVTVIPTVDGRFSASLKLTPGVWRLTAVGADREGVTVAPVTVTVTVPLPPLKVTIQVKGGTAWLKLWADGEVLPGYSKFFASGTVINITATESVWIRTNSAVRTYVIINGVAYGPLAGARPGSWRITADGPPVPSQDN